MFWSTSYHDGKAKKGKKKPTPKSRAILEKSVEAGLKAAGIGTGLPVIGCTGWGILGPEPASGHLASWLSWHNGQAHKYALSTAMPHAAGAKASVLVMHGYEPSDHDQFEADLRAVGKAELVVMLCAGEGAASNLQAAMEQVVRVFPGTQISGEPMDVLLVAPRFS